MTFLSTPCWLWQRDLSGSAVKPRPLGRGVSIGLALSLRAITTQLKLVLQIDFYLSIV